MIRISREALSTFWTDTGKAMLVTAVPLLMLDWILLDQTRAGVFFFFFVTVGLVAVPLGLFALATTAMVLIRRRPGLVAGSILMLLLHEAFRYLVR
jgi:hypothetical protein